MSWWVWLNIVLAVAWLLPFARKHNQGACFHRFRRGSGPLGLSWACDKCGLECYPEQFRFRRLYRALGRVKGETYLMRRKKP